MGSEMCIRDRHATVTGNESRKLLERVPSGSAQTDSRYCKLHRAYSRVDTTQIIVGPLSAFSSMSFEFGQARMAENLSQTWNIMSLLLSSCHICVSDLLASRAAIVASSSSADHTSSRILLSLSFVHYHDICCLQDEVRSAPRTQWSSRCHFTKGKAWLKASKRRKQANPDVKHQRYG